MTSNYNPYDYMLSLRENRILFQYLEDCGVYYSDNKGWVIHGESNAGLLEIYELVNNLIRFSIPIKTPKFVNLPILSEIVLRMQPTIEGLITIDIDEEGSDLFLVYSFHINPADEKSLDTCLIKFKQEEREILEGFSMLEKDFNKMTNQLKNSGPNYGRAPDEENLDSLWDDMDSIDKSFDEEDL